MRRAASALASPRAAALEQVHRRVRPGGTGVGWMPVGDPSDPRGQLGLAALLHLLAGGGRLDPLHRRRGARAPAGAVALEPVAAPQGPEHAGPAAGGRIAGVVELDQIVEAPLAALRARFESDLPEGGEVDGAAGLLAPPVDAAEVGQRRLGRVHRQVTRGIRPPPCRGGGGAAGRRRRRRRSPCGSADPGRDTRTEAGPRGGTPARRRRARERASRRVRPAPGAPPPGGRRRRGSWSDVAASGPWSVRVSSPLRQCQPQSEGL